MVKHCSHCGKEVNEDAIVCISCGCAVTPAMRVEQTSIRNENETLEIVTKVFLIVGCVSWGWLILPLAWCVPITVSIFNKFRDKQPIGNGVKICSLLFVNFIAGICLLCMHDDE